MIIYHDTQDNLLYHRINRSECTQDNFYIIKLACINRTDKPVKQYTAQYFKQLLASKKIIAIRN